LVMIKLSPTTETQKLSIHFTVNLRLVVSNRTKKRRPQSSPTADTNAFGECFFFNFLPYFRYGSPNGALVGDSLETFLEAFK
jgi:hypothetical protein